MGKLGQRDFSGGWRPSDDAINGAPNGLLRMNNVDLDANGALSLIGGTATVGSAYSNDLHSIYSKTMNGTRRIYCADTAGAILRGNTSIGTSGSGTKAAFGTAFNYVLACSGNTRKKDDGTTAVNLGVGKPTAKLTLLKSDTYPQKIITDFLYDTVDDIGSSTVVGTYRQMTADANGVVAVQTYNNSSDPRNAATLTDNSGSDVSYGKDSDTITLCGYTPNPIGKKLFFSVLLVASAASGVPVSDFYLYEADLASDPTYEPSTGVFTLTMKRSDFVRIGGGTQDWNTTYGVRVTYIGDPGDVINILGSLGTNGYINIRGGSSAQNGSYQYMQVNVNNTGSYQALSPMGPISDIINVKNQQVKITPQSPAAIDTQVNEVWVYRRGGKLETWYRVHVFLAAGSWALEHDNLDDEGALALNIKYNQNLTTVASSGISDAILDVIGPIQGRWYYFTANFMYPSDINNPDLVDATKGVRLTGSNNEIFLWAKQVDKATVLVGTSVDVYVLTGTFATLPDFTIDIYYYPLGCKYPPIAYDADVYNGDVVYMASDGWRIINIGKENPLIVSPTSDLLYKGITRHSYTAPNLKVTPGSTRFPVCLAKNKVWCFITGTNRCEVFDFNRRYWRTFNYGLGDVACTTSSQDGQVLAYYSADKRVRELDVKTTKLVDGSTKQQIDLLFTVKDGDMPRNRKDTSVFKARCYTGGSDTFSVTIANEDGNGQIVGTLSSASIGLDKYIDLSNDPYVALCKTYKVGFVGFVADFLLQDWEILFEPRPEQVSFKRILNNNYGTAARKRIRVLSRMLDTLGNSVIFTPYVDNIAQATSTFSTSNKDTVRHYFTSDVSGVDYGGTLHCSSGLFEDYGELEPTIVQLFPIAKKFDQLGPEEFFRFGKILKMELRILPVGGTSIPYKIYFQDSTVKSDSITVLSDVDATYVITLPKGTSGNVARFELGPTVFNFHRFYIRVLIDQSGTDTENKWITLA